MSAFANLMALSATQTKQQENELEQELRERKRQEALKRKQLEEQEAKEREREKQRRLKLFEDKKREEERLKRLEESKEAKEKELQRRKAEERDRLLFGPKKAAKLGIPSSSRLSKPGEGARRRSDESDDDSGPIPLTREELRQRKQQAEMKRLYGTTKKASTSAGGGYQKSGRRLPGGAVDVTATSTNSGSPSGDHRSAKDRLAAMPNVLVKLNPVKRDTRTIDEIVADRARLKRGGEVLEGTDALKFQDWFADKKKGKAPDKKTPPLASRPSSVAPNSGANTPLSSQHTSEPRRLAPTAKPAPPQRPSTVPNPRASVHSGSLRPSVSSRPTTAADRDRATDKLKPTQSKSSRPSNYERERERDRDRDRDRERDPYYSAGRHASTTNPPKKRNRSEGRSVSPLPKRRNRGPFDDEEELDVSNEIWKLFGRDRRAYVSKDVISDDEDMEADAFVMEREERASARVAAREEQLALEEERRHEEEKRRRKRLAAQGK